MKKRIVLALCLLMLLSAAACRKAPAPGSSGHSKPVFDVIRESAAAKLELPDGSGVFVDSEIASLRSFAEFKLQEAPMEPADSEEDWLYRITFNPAEKVKGGDEYVVSFHQDYVQIGAELYLPEDGTDYGEILAWAEGKFDALMP